jgi:hypothetical protein
MGAPGRRVRRDGPAASSGRGGARVVDRRPSRAAPTSTADADPPRRPDVRRTPSFSAPRRAPSRARRRALALPCVHRASASEFHAPSTCVPTPRVGVRRATTRRTPPAPTRKDAQIDPAPTRSVAPHDSGTAAHLRAARLRNRTVPSRRTTPAPTLAARMGAPGRRVRRDGPAASSGRGGGRGRRPPARAAPTSTADVVALRRARFIARPRAARPAAPPSRARWRALALPCVHRASASEFRTRR